MLELRLIIKSENIFKVCLVGVSMKNKIKSMFGAVSLLIDVSNVYFSLLIFGIYDVTVSTRGDN